MKPSATANCDFKSLIKGGIDAENLRQIVRPGSVVYFAPCGTFGKSHDETINETINETIKSAPGISLRGIVEKVGKSRATVSRVLATLKESGTVEYRGSKKTGGYYAKGLPRQLCENRDCNRHNFN